MAWDIFSPPASECEPPTPFSVHIDAYTHKSFTLFIAIIIFHHFCCDFSQKYAIQIRNYAVVRYFCRSARRDTRSMYEPGLLPKLTRPFDSMQIVRAEVLSVFNVIFSVWVFLVVCVFLPFFSLIFRNEVYKPLNAWYSWFVDIVNPCTDPKQMSLLKLWLSSLLHMLQETEKTTDICLVKNMYDWTTRHATLLGTS